MPFANYLSAYIRGDLHLAAAVAGEGWLATGVAGALGGVLFGAIGDKVSLQVALIAATALLSTSAMLAAVGTTAAHLVFAAGCFGASFFPIFGLLPAYVGKTSKADLTPAICGLVECSLGLGGALGSFLGGFSPQVLGSFRPVYISAGLLSALMVCLACFLPKKDDAETPLSWRSAPERG